MAKANTITSTNIKGPHYLSIILFSLLSLSMAGLMAWKQYQEYIAETTPETFQWLLVAGICALGSLILVLWVIVVLMIKVVRLRKIRTAHEGDIQYLRGELQTGMRELEIQQDMQQTLLENDSSQHMLELARELLRAQNISFWRIRDEQLACLNALKESKGAYERGAVIHSTQYPTLFRMLLANECVQYPEAIAPAQTDEVEPKNTLGNLLHYIENNQIQALLIIPVEIDGQVAGAAWFEHREVKRQWTIRDKNQAHFVASIVRMQFYKKLQKGIINELSEVLHQFDNFRNNAHFGMCWFQLTTPLSLDQENISLATTIGEQAVLEEANHEATKQFLRDDMPFLGSPLQSYLPEGLLTTFVENKLQVNNYEWEYQHHGVRKVLMMSLHGIRIHGELVGIWLVSNDITQIKAKEWETTTLLNKTTGIFTLVDQDAQIISDSNSIHQLGYELHERVGKNLLDYIYPPDVAKVEQVLQEIKRGPNTEGELAAIRMLDQTGLWRYFRVYFKNLVHENHADGILIEMHDVELQVKETRAKDEKLAFLDALIKHGDEVIMVLDVDGAIIYESHNSKRMIGYTAEERIGKFGFEFIHQTDMEALEKAFVKLKAGKITAHRQDIQFLHRDGQWRDMEFYMTKNEAAQYVARIKDIGQTKKAEVMSANREALLQTFLKASNKLYVLTNSRGKIKYASGDFMGMLGIPAEQLIGSHLSKLILTNEREALAHNLDRLVQNQKAQVHMYLHLPAANDELKYFALKSHGHLLEKAYTGLLLELELIQLDDEADTNLSLKAEFFQSLANSFPSPLLFLDQQHVVKFANSASVSLLGKPLTGNFLDLIIDTEQEQITNWLETRQPQALEVSFKGESQDRAKRKAQLFELKGSKLKGTLIYIRAKSTEEEQELRKAYQLIDTLQEDISTLKQELANVETHELLQEKLNAYRRQLTELLDEGSSKQQEIDRYAAQEQELAAQLKAFAGLEEPAEALATRVNTLVELIRKYQEISTEADL
ncbi:MAG: PAS domain S-box protein, partial [Flammeovirgaceae bacterium]